MLVFGRATAYRQMLLLEWLNTHASRVAALPKRNRGAEGYLRDTTVTKNLEQCHEREGQQHPPAIGGTCHRAQPSHQKFPHNRRHASACLPRVRRDLRHDRAVADRKGGGSSPLTRTSAWLAPGLALGWLAVLATFVHSVGNLLAAWAATVSLVVLLARWRPTAPPSSRPENADGSAMSSDPEPVAPGGTSESSPGTTPEPSSSEEGAADGAGHSTSAAANAATSVPSSYGPPSGPSPGAEPVPSDNASRTAPGTSVSATADQTRQTGTAEIAVTLGLQVLTAAEVATMLRVEVHEIITAIRSGELPGNRIGSHWRVDQDALTRWLQGRYGDLTGRADPPSVTAPGISPV